MEETPTPVTSRRKVKEPYLTYNDFKEYKRKCNETTLPQDHHFYQTSLEFRTPQPQKKRP